MRPLWPSLGAAVVSLALCFGCTGQNLEGRWRGPFPLEDAKACVLNLYSDRRFDLGCQDHAWLGGGRYTRDGDRLTFNFSMLARRESPVARPPVVRATLIGHGNEITLVSDTGAKYVLTRKLD